MLTDCSQRWTTLGKMEHCDLWNITLFWLIQNHNMPISFGPLGGVGSRSEDANSNFVLQTGQFFLEFIFSWTASSISCSLGFNVMANFIESGAVCIAKKKKFSAYVSPFNFICNPCKLLDDAVFIGQAISIWIDILKLLQLKCLLHFSCCSREQCA